MKLLENFNLHFFVAAFLAASFSGCASPNPNTPIQMTSSGPNILNARAEPQVITLNKDFQPTVPGEVIADVKDFKYQIADVHLKFENLPLSVPMENVGGTTWRAELSPKELQLLAVSGRTVKYKAEIVATDTVGNVETSSQPLTVAVNAPEVSEPAPANPTS